MLPTPCIHNHIYSDGLSHSRYHLNRDHILWFSAASLKPSFFQMKAVVIEELLSGTSSHVFCHSKGERNQCLSRNCNVHRESFTYISPLHLHNGVAEPTQQWGKRVEGVKCPARLRPCISNYKGCASRMLCYLSADCGDLWCVHDTGTHVVSHFPL